MFPGVPARFDILQVVRDGPSSLWMLYKTLGESSSKPVS